MGSRCPPNLTHSTAYLKDSPYEVQLGVLKYLRSLVFEVVEASTRAALENESERQGNGGDDECSRQDGESRLLEAEEEEEEEEGMGKLDGQKGEREGAIVDTSGHEDGSDGSTAATRGGRKRPRTATLHGRDSFGLGSVVECFHADDGFWYPATITAVIPPPPEAPAAESLTSEKGEGGPLPFAPKSTVAGGSKEEDSAIDTSMEAATTVGMAASTVVGTEAGSEEDLTHAQRKQQLLDVTFVGYGNQSRVPRGWVREIVTPEVLEWCKDNGIVAASAGVSQEEAPVHTAGTSAVAANEGISGDDDDGATTSVACPSTPGTGGEQPVAGEGGGGAVGGGSGGGSGGKQGKQQPRKRKKNNKKNNNNKNNRGYRNKSKGVKRQVGTEEEEEERFLMRCASRSKSPYPHVPNKYWGQRYRYFSRFDEGVGMDKEGWYSVTPEAIALHIAERVCCDVVVDPFVGCGGNAVQFALVSHLVFAIDIDPVKLEHARRNAAIYGVENRIEFILGDAMKVLPTLNADVVFLSPPWGGPAYQDSKTFDLKTMIPPPLSALEMFRAARKVTPNVVFFLPRNVDAAQVAGLPTAAAALEAGETPAANTFGVGFDDTCELEKQFLNGKLKTTTAYFGEDIAITVGKKKASKGSDASAGVDEGSGVGAEPPLHQQGARALDLSAQPNGSSDWYGDGGQEGATWSGRHVRFSEEGAGGGDEGDAAEIGNDGVPSISQERENALYEAWMTT